MNAARAIAILEAIRELAEETVPACGEPESWSPQKPTEKQKQFLDETAFECLYGGSAGGGKSSTLLMAALEYMHVPGYSALILRRTYKDLALPDAIMDRSHQWLRNTPARWRGKDYRWEFPSGATLTFGFLDRENDRFRYQGAAVQFCVAKGTPIVMGNGRMVPIEKLQVGDEVATLMGPRPLTRVMEVGRKPVISIDTEHGATLAAYDHRILSAGQRPWAPTECPLCGKPYAGSQARYLAHRMPASCPSADLSPWLECGKLGSASAARSGSASNSRGGKIAVSRFHGSRLGALPPQGWSAPLMLLAPHALSKPRMPSEKQFEHGAWSATLASSAPDWPPDYRDACDCGGAPPPAAQAGGPAGIPSPGDAGSHSPSSAPAGDLASTQRHSPRGQFATIAHPYTRIPFAPQYALHPGLAYMAPAGEAECWDLTVAEASHYVSWGGAISANCAFDELTQFKESDYRYLLSRVRRLQGSPVPLRVRAATNPGGVGHDWVKKRFVDEGAVGTFIPAKLTDNPHLDQEAYLNALNLLDDLTRRQLRDGEWVRDAGGIIYPFKHDLNAISEMPSGRFEYIVSVDLGASTTKPTTALQVVACSIDDPHVYMVESMLQATASPGAIADLIRPLLQRYDPFKVVVDHGGLGIGYIEEFRTRYNIPCDPAQNRNKLGYRRLMRGDMERGRLKIITKGQGHLIAEMGKLHWNEAETDCEPGALDHATDACLYGFIEAHHFLHTEPTPRPPRGTPEAIELELEEMADEEADAMEMALSYAARRGRGPL